MERKTKVHAEDGKQDLLITREFNLPLELLFKAHTEAGLLEQWMGTKVLKLDYQKHGSYQIETRDPQGNVAFRANGVVHQLITDQKIIRTFEMEGAPFGVQLEVYDFEALTPGTSKLTMHTIYETGAQRDQLLKLPFTQGINMAHNRMEELISKLNNH
jgi:uncharacterized protein YndB with AHSA1/START domain